MLYLNNPDGISSGRRRRQLDLMEWMNRRHHEEVNDPEILSRIASYEMAYRMQSSVPELTDLKSESAKTLEAYGANPSTSSFANNCLLARRLVSGVRFVQLYDRGWDSHTDIEKQHVRQCRGVDRPIAALIKDLKQRGLLEDTLVIWGANSGVPRSPRFRVKPMDATITLTVSPCGWREAASSPA